MGLDANGVLFLILAERLGVSFEDVATIGRQQLHLHSGLLAERLQLFDGRSGRSRAQELLSGDAYCEPFLRFLGAERTSSIDASAYEGATILHDMNRPVGDELKNAFSAVIDGGSLEHVFEFPTAIRSCMEMVRVGGHYLGITPTNNYTGHGFYQFSPEVLYRIFSPDNGFSMERMFACEALPGARWYEVRDPSHVGGRVTLVNELPTYLLFLARKDADVPVLTTPPQQSDYEVLWRGEAATGSEPREESAVRRAGKRVKGRLPRWVYALHLVLKAQRKGRLGDGDVFRTFDAAGFLRQAGREA